jgi:hypothetical protein
MTTTAHRIQTVVDGEFVETPTGPVSPPPQPEPSSFAVRASALVLLGSLFAAAVGVNRQPDGLEVAASAVFAAVVLFLACLFRQEAQP